MAEPGFPRDSNLLFGIVFAESCMKMKKIGLRSTRDALPDPPLGPYFRSFANVGTAFCYDTQRSCRKVMFLHLSVILLTGGSLSGGSLSREGLCPEGVSVPRGSLSRGSLSGGGLCPGWGLYPGGSLSKGSLSIGGLCPGVSFRRPPSPVR